MSLPSAEEAAEAARLASTTPPAPPERPAPVKPMPNHFSAGVMWRIEPGTENQMQFLVIDYAEKGRTSTVKFPGGTNRISKEPLQFRDEDPVTTLCSEWLDEVGQTLEYKPGETFLKVLYGGPERGGNHTQRFYLFHESDAHGAFRTEEKIDEEPGSRPEILSPPRWVNVEVLLDPMGPMGKSHGAALEALYPKAKLAAEAMPK